MEKKNLVLKDAIIVYVYCSDKKAIKKVSFELLESLKIPDINFINTDTMADPKKTPGLRILVKPKKISLKKRPKPFASTVAIKYPIDTSFQPICSDVPISNQCVNDKSKMPEASREVGAVFKMEIPKDMQTTFAADDVNRSYILKVSHNRMYMKSFTI